jgi:hypothetical protein
MPNRSRAADSIVLGSLAMRRISPCKEVLDRRMKAISEFICPYSSVEALNSALDRTITVEHIPSVARIIIARKIHEGITRNQLSVAGNSSREISRTGTPGSVCTATRAVNCRLLSQ